MDHRPKLSKSERTRASILNAARELFAGSGYDGTSVRDIAGLANIDPALVIRYFGSKDALFAQATEFHIGMPSLDGLDRAEIGAALVGHFLDVWEGPNSTGAFTILLRSAASNEHAANRLREVFAGQVLPTVVALTGMQGAAFRAGLIASQVLGLALCRYVLKIPPVVMLERDQLTQQVGQTLQAYLAFDPA